MRNTLLLLCGLAATAALARDNGQYPQASPDIQNWIRGLTDQQGVGCCDTADGFPAEVDWDTAAGRYRVRIDGAWWPVPDHAVVTQPNRLGYAVVWYWRESDGRPRIRCFLPGGGS